MKKCMVTHFGILENGLNQPTCARMWFIKCLIFQSILNYLRTGELHIPSYVCGPAAKSELEFWGVSDDVIERCCWTNYNSWNSTQQALNQLERDRKVSFYHSEDPNKVTGCWKKAQAQAWEILNRPNSSRMAKTHPSFGYNKTILDTTNKSVNNSTAENVTDTLIYRQVPVTHPVLNIINICCVCFFALEYLSRIIFAHQRFKYIRSLMGVIDFLALVPDCVQFIAYTIKPELEYDGTVEFIAILRIARVLRVFRLIRHVPGLWILIYTLKASIKELLLMTVFLIVGMLFFSSLMYYAEDREDFKSIPHGFWWALITMTTVGYGDMYPKTAWGYLIGSFTALMGLLMIGFSVPVLVSNFIMYYKHVEFALNQERIAKEKDKRKLEEISEQQKPLINQNKNDFFVNNNSTQETVLLSDMDKESPSKDT
ncbi:hypothetical protein KUTeg_010930 [Tegillarca granosa]|uniref:Uncharacterized protein n=1 Tax=Tegillarca granosa TaxID=220873 RepID=A0ABQ9F5N6_TEGGR|nr:hypothetical protein KUTeg_010930 [Tegillarca granosa]